MPQMMPIYWIFYFVISMVMLMVMVFLFFYKNSDNILMNFVLINESNEKTNYKW